MKKERRTLPIKAVLKNVGGQVEWLPKNPREWTKEDLERTKRSLERDPDFLEDRPLLVIPKGGSKWITFAGNLRREAAQKIGMKEVPCIIYYDETDEDRETIKRRALLDNGSFGKNDYDALANEWTEFDLVELGIPSWEMEQEDEAASGGGAPALTAISEDEFDEDKDFIAVRCQKGDIWQLGEHRLVCGDSIDLEVVKNVMGGGQSRPLNN